MIRTLHTLGLFFILAVFLAGCSLLQQSASPSPTPNRTQSATNGNGGGPLVTPVPANRPTATPTPAPTPAPTPTVQKVTLAAIGDVLLHNTVFQDALRAGQGSYDFKPMFGKVRDVMLASDVLVANQESITGGVELGLSSYPLFNSPHEIGDALQDAGVNVVTMANNHAMDKGEPGILSAIEYWNKLGMTYTGAFVSQEDRDRIRVVTEQGISFAFLAYTYGTNGLSVPAAKPYLVNRTEEQLMEADIGRARKLADIVVVSTHWGTEDQPKYNESQRSLAAKLAEWGADIVIGTHPHVLQPFTWLPKADGKRTLVLYSLGNFLSAQAEMPELIGGLAEVDIIKTTTGGTVTTELAHPRLLPTYNKYEAWSHFCVVPFPQLEAADAGKVLPVWEPIKQRMLAEMPELEIQDGQ